MAHYFGFIPSDKLNDMIDEAEKIITSNETVDYYPYRNELTQQIASELIDSLLVSLIDVIPNPERQASMRKIIETIERATETLLNVLLGKDKNEDIMPSFNFLKNQSMFIDNEGLRRVGFKLSKDSAQTIIEGFASVTPGTVDKVKFKTALETMNEEALTHFISRFTETLKLGMIKRKSIPVAKAAIDKGMSMAINKLLPQLPDAGLNRLASFYRPFLIEIADE
ncbi:hypothetical protein [Psychrobacter sp. LV10R520-6]|uniref:hypothetical protein n=1 Tax=Psychrobacter sp. LV10R520-6 TaxID=1415574 RepID=UPI0024CDD865|nr:hypothetical protein [Psychrobacter sp. LV10R520-6]SNT69831.1 hypothetical protein SAMN04488491_0939 [Psychrobacter sp. LV10R520-6]